MHYVDFDFGRWMKFVNMRVNLTATIFLARYILLNFFFVLTWRIIKEHPNKICNNIWWDLKKMDSNYLLK